MDKTKIKKLASYSFSGNKIDEKKTKKVSKLLKRADLKEYIEELKIMNDKGTVILVVPNDKIDGVALVANKLKKLYPNKRLMIQTDPSLIAGIKIINNDIIYELTLKQMLESAVSKL